MAAPAPVEPITYGKYTLFERLGAGGMAEVFLARQDGAGGFAKKVVVKRILGDFAHDATFVDMFLAEARLAAHLSHPNIVQIFDMGQEGETYFIAMEYVAGPNLLHLLRYATLAKDPRVQSFAKIASGIAEGLYYAHNASGPDGEPLRIVHRDINPPNIIVSSEGIPKICDFGVAKSANRESTTGSNLKGKYTYMSPEQIKGEKIDHRADIFSLGVVIFETTTNKRLFKRDTELAVLNAVLSDPIPSPSQIVKGYPPKLEQIVMWCLERDREKRCPDARTLHNVLEEYLKQDPQGMTQVQLGEWVRSVLPPDVRDSVSGQYGFYSLPGAPAPGTRTPTGWTPSGAAGAAGTPAERSPNPNALPPARPGTQSGSRPSSKSGISQRPQPAPMGEPDAATRAGKSASFSVVEDPGFQAGRTGEPSTQPFSVPSEGSSLGKWFGIAVGLLIVGGVAALVVTHGSNPAKPEVAPGPTPPGPATAAPQQNSEEVAKYYTDEAKRLIGQGKYGPAASLVSKAKELRPAAPQTNVAIAELEEEAEVGARLAGAKQALADNDLDRSASLAKLVLDKEPTQSDALALLKAIRSRTAPPERVRSHSRSSGGPGTVSIDAPAGSRVYIDDEPVGQAPIANYSVAAGPHRVEVRRDGFRPETHDIRISTGRNERVSAQMTATEEVRVALASPKEVVPKPTPIPSPPPPSAAPKAPEERPAAAPRAAAPVAVAVAPTPAPAPAPPPPAPIPVAVEPPKPPPPPPGALFTQAMTRPVKVTGQDVRYPSDALAAGASGLVIATCDISAEGSVHGCKVIKHVPFMDQPVIDALQSWTMKPATLDGKPVALRSYTFQMKLVAPQ